MTPEGYVKKAIEIASAGDLLPEVIEYALDEKDEFTTNFEALNYALKFYNLQTVPEASEKKINRILIPIENDWAEPFRVEYDGKYLTLFGRDTNYQVPDYSGARIGAVEYEEMVLVPVVEEIRNITLLSCSNDTNTIVIVYEINDEDK